MSRWFVATRGRALSVSGTWTSHWAKRSCRSASWHSCWSWTGGGSGFCAAVVALGAIPVLWALRLERTPQSHAEENHATGMDAGDIGAAPRCCDTGCSGSWSPRCWVRRPSTPTFSFSRCICRGEGLGAYFASSPFSRSIPGSQSGRCCCPAGCWTGFGTARLIPWYQVPMVAAFSAYSLGDKPFHRLSRAAFHGPDIRLETRHCPTPSGRNSTAPGTSARSRRWPLR